MTSGVHQFGRGCCPMSIDQAGATALARSGTDELARRIVTESLGTGLLVTVVVGSGAAAARLSPEDAGQQRRDSVEVIQFLGRVELLDNLQ